jgi:hypothetical protein
MFPVCTFTYFSRLSVSFSKQVLIMKNASLQPPAHAGSSLADFSTLKMEAIRSSETSAHTGTIRRHIPENGILYSHLPESLKSCKFWSNLFAFRTSFSPATERPCQKHSIPAGYSRDFRFKSRPRDRYSSASSVPPDIFQDRSWLHLSISFPIHYLLIILSFDAL